MKTTFLKITLAVMLFALMGAGCEKEKEGIPSTITLYDKPLFVIQTAIKGKWQLHYGKGGIIANYIQYFPNTFWTFSSNRIVQSYDGIVVTDTTIKWEKDSGMYTHNVPSYIMNFYDKRGYPYVYIVDGIFNDTLVLRDYSFDSMTYHFTKQ